ncbi:hypothetical protein AB0E69_08120 [Kribbella sp. NPDC026611]|uniref:DUF7489 domain-containing protein n=1 Tax=Kribbella sp. NPDC026611 TaxID=3154911 RepID=UPI0033C8E007
MSDKDVWAGTVVKKSRGLMDGSNMYRRLKVELDGGSVEKVRVPRNVWDEVAVGDRVVKEAGTDPRRA